MRVDDLRRTLGLTDRSLLLLSPHLDDAWLGAAAIAAGDCEVWTVFAGEPHPAQHTEWDDRCGFADSSATMAARRAEDRAAFADRPTSVRHLPLLDAAYRTRAQEDGARAALAAEVRAWLTAHPAGVLVLPVGAGTTPRPAPWQGLRDRLRPATATTATADTPSAAAQSAPPSRLLDLAKQPVRRLMHADHQRRRHAAQRRGMASNPDHLLVRDVGVAAARALPEVDVLLWEELPYLWHERGHAAAQRTAHAAGRGMRELTVPVDVTAKFDRVRHYRSQLDLLDPDARRLSRPEGLPSTETYWWLR